MKKPENITKNDWSLLVEKYPDNLEFLEKKLNENYPIQYLIGNVNFFGHKIIVDERCLLPRFETELLVDKTIQLIHKKNISQPKLLDIGTGSGCIAITLAKYFPGNILALDISKEALELAQENAENNEVRINFWQQDILKLNSLEYYDVIISNPPYIADDETVDKETKYEPQIALYAKNNGLQYYEHILKIANKETPIIAFEIGASQGQAVKELAKKYFPSNKIICEKDYTGKDRFVFITKEDKYEKI